MLDRFHIISSKDNPRDNFRVYYAAGTNVWQTWTKPRKCSFVWILCIGGGAGGAGGGAGATTAATGGGTGGTVKILYPAHVLPDVLYVQPGPGGAGGAGSATTTPTAAGAANRSLVSISAASASNTTYACASGQTAATGSTGETGFVTAIPSLMSTGIYTVTTGQPGSNGTVSPFINTTASMLCPGAGGSNPFNVTAFPGGDIQSVTVGSINTPPILGGAIGNAGSNGIWNWNPFMYGLGGSGGGGSSSGNAFAGGNGAYGCGGGGGGAAPSGSTGGAGGAGGDGLVIIQAF